MRRMEQAADALYKQKMIRGFCHLSIGQEAVSVGMEASMDKEDRLITAYRCHTFAVMRGGTIKGVLAELMGELPRSGPDSGADGATGRQDGMSNGKGGSMHIFTPSFFGGNGIVGAQVSKSGGTNEIGLMSIGTGGSGNRACTEVPEEVDGDLCALRRRRVQPRPSVRVVQHGERILLHTLAPADSFQAKLWNLPCVFVCENNKYGMGTSAERSSMNTSFFTRGDQIPGLQVNGMDILAVRKATEFAKEWTTSGKGPLVMEMVTYRYGGHS